MERQAGEIRYQLTRKQVKNLNLRVTAEGEVRVSAPKRVPVGQIDAFVQTRADWIRRAQARMQAGAPPSQRHTPEECLALFTRISERIYPLFADRLAQPPLLRVREMKTRWGVCHPAKGYITLNSLLLQKPMEAIEYVLLHEYVHFIHPNHQQGFHAMMAALMPDYRHRRALLRTNDTK